MPTASLYPYRDVRGQPWPMMEDLYRHCAPLLCSLALMACGGGGDAGAPPAPDIPALPSKISGDFDTGAAWISIGEGWGFARLDPEADPHAQPYDVLIIVFGYPTPDLRVYRDFDLRGKNVATLNFSIFQEAFAYPWFAGPINLAIRKGGGDPFSGGVRLDTFLGSIGCGASSCDPFSYLPHENYMFSDQSYDISACAGTICSVGFQLPAVGSSVPGGRTLIRDFSIDLL